MYYGVLCIQNSSVQIHILDIHCEKRKEKQLLLAFIVLRILCSRAQICTFVHLVHRDFVSLTSGREACALGN